MLDAPVSGGPTEVGLRAALYLVGGTDAAVRAAEPVLRALAPDEGQVVLLGEVGKAKAAKLVNNVLTYGNMLIVAEAFVVGVKAGLDPARLYGLLSRSAGRSHQATKRLPRALRRDFRPGGTIATAVKDLDLAMSLGGRSPVPCP